MKLWLVFIAGVLIFGSSSLLTSHGAMDINGRQKIDSATIRINWQPELNATYYQIQGGPSLTTGFILGGTAFGAFLLVYSKKSGNR